MLSPEKVQQILHELQGIGTSFQPQKPPIFHLLAADAEPLDTFNTTTSVSTVQIRIFWWPWWAT